MSRLVAYIFFTVSAYVAFGQTYNNFIAGGYTPGYLLAHQGNIKHLAAHNFGLETSFEREVGYKDWAGFYNKPTVGLGILYYNLGREETGHAIGALFTTKFNVSSYGNTNLNFRMGAGLSYLSKRFDVYSNRRNQAIGSNINGSMQFGMLLHTPIGANKSSYLEYGLSISHYSNAAFKMPNLGYNIPSISLRYGMGLKQQEVSQELPKEIVNPWKLNTIVLFGKKERGFSDPQTFHHVGMQVRAIKQVNMVKAWRFGMDGLLDKTYKFSEDPTIALDSIKFMDKLELGMSGGYQWSIGKVDVIAELGAYIYKPAVLKNPLLQRVGLVYNVSEQLKVLGALRFHRGVADFFEVGVGYTVGL